MSKKSNKPTRAAQPQFATVAKYPYPSVFGSHASMVVKENEDGTVICHDEFGDYVTPKCRLDNGCADPNRYTVSRISKLFAGRKAE